MKEEKNIRVMWLVSAVMLMLAGVIAMLFPEQATKSLTIVITVFMLIAGIVQLMTFYVWRDYIRTTNWILVDGLITTVLAIIILVTPALTTVMIPYIFSLWLLFSGLAKIASAYELKEYDLDDWKWAVILGSVETIFAIVMFAYPGATSIVLGFLIGLIFLVKGVSIFTTGMMVRQMFQKPKPIKIVSKEKSKKHHS